MYVYVIRRPWCLMIKGCNCRVHACIYLQVSFYLSPKPAKYIEVELYVKAWRRRRWFVVSTCRRYIHSTCRRLPLFNVKRRSTRSTWLSTLSATGRQIECRRSTGHQNWTRSTSFYTLKVTGFSRQKKVDQQTSTFFYIQGDSGLVAFYSRLVRRNLATCRQTVDLRTVWTRLKHLYLITKHRTYASRGAG